MGVDNVGKFPKHLPEICMSIDTPLTQLLISFCMDSKKSKIICNSVLNRIRRSVFQLQDFFMV